MNKTVYSVRGNMREKYFGRVGAEQLTLAVNLDSEQLAQQTLLAAAGTGEWVNLEILAKSVPVVFELTQHEKDLAKARFLQPEIQAYRVGDYIEAIKSVRARTGLGLKEAKDLVDAYGTTLTKNKT